MTSAFTLNAAFLGTRDKSAALRTSGVLRCNNRTANVRFLYERTDGLRGKLSVARYKNTLTEGSVVVKGSDIFSKGARDRGKHKINTGSRDQGEPDHL